LSEQIEFLKRQFKITEENKNDDNNVRLIKAKERKSIEYDPNGFFVIHNDLEKKQIIAEHYENVLDGGAMLTGKLTSTIVGKTATAVYQAIIENEKASLPEHYAYLGKELHKAEMSLKFGLQYTQDKPIEISKSQK